MGSGAGRGGGMRGEREETGIMTITSLRTYMQGNMWQVDVRRSGAAGTHASLKWTTGTCFGCHYKPAALTANDSYPYSSHPDWWWQKSRYSPACVTQHRSDCCHPKPSRRPSTPGNTRQRKRNEWSLFIFAFLICQFFFFCSCSPYFPSPTHLLSSPVLVLPPAPCDLRR